MGDAERDARGLAPLHSHWPYQTDGISAEEHDCTCSHADYATAIDCPIHGRNAPQDTA